MKPLLTLLLLLTHTLLSAQSPDWSWAAAAGSHADDEGNSVATDSSGNIIVTGFFRDTMMFGTISLISRGDFDFFVAKYDPLGTVLWAQRFGGFDDDRGMSVAVDRNNNIIVTGYYKSTDLVFGPILTNSGGQDMFIVKFGPSGNVLWASSAAGTANDVGHTVTTDSVGNIYLIGAFSSLTLDFGSTGTTLTNLNIVDGFISKYSSSGVLIWARDFGTTWNDLGSSIAMVDDRSFVISGYTDAPAIAFGNDVLYSNSFGEIFVVKYDTSGNVLWARGADGAGSTQSLGYDFDLGNCVSTDREGNVFVSGLFSSTGLDFGGTVLTSPTYQSMYLAKYDSTGNLHWATSVNTSSNINLFHNSICTDDRGNVYMAGFFANNTLVIGSDTLINHGGFDIVIAKYDSSGSVLWAKNEGGSGYEQPNDIAVDKDGNAVITGFFGSPTFQFGSSPVSNAGVYDVFVAKLDNTINGIEIIKVSDGLTIYPNPAKDLIFISGQALRTNSTVTIIAMNGKIIRQENVNETTGAINIKNIDAGMYVLEIRSGELTERKRIIVVGNE